MPVSVTGSEDGGLVWQNPDGDAVTGRWCMAPEEPDRCYTCFEPSTLRHYAATGYSEDADGLRKGTCSRCEGED